jgi:hypothetical protein
VEGLKARRGDLSGPVLAILVTLILLAIGAVIIAYFTLLAGPAPTPVLVVKDQPIAYQDPTATSNAKVDIVVANIGTAQVTLDGTHTKLEILGPFTISSASLGSNPTIAPGESKTLTFTFTGGWTTGKFKDYRSASARLVLKDAAGNTIAQFEVSIRIIGGG